MRWRSAALFSFFGIAGAFAGSTLGKAVDGRRMLLLFGLLMLVIAVLVFRRRDEASDRGPSCTREKVPKILGFGAATGALSGFFGIGGGFLIVPGLIASTRMPMVDAVGSSLVAVTAFGLTTALNYAVSGLVDWRLAAAIVVGGFVGCRVGCFASHHTAARKGLLTSLFAGLVACVAAYMIFEGVTAA